MAQQVASGGGFGGSLRYFKRSGNAGLNATALLLALVAAFPALAGSRHTLARLPPDDGSPVPALTLTVQSIEPFTTTAQAAPPTLVLPKHTVVTLAVTSSAPVLGLTWNGAREVFRSVNSSVARVSFSTPGVFLISAGPPSRRLKSRAAREQPRRGNGTSILVTVTDVAAEDIAITITDPVATPMIGSVGKRFYCHARTSIPGYEHLIEWRGGGEPATGFGPEFRTYYRSMGRYTLRAGPTAALTIDILYEITGIRRASPFGQVVWYGYPIVFTAVTSPAEYEANVSWSIDTMGDMHTHAEPSRGTGASFTTTFTNPSGDDQFWAQVYADSVPALSQTDPADLCGGVVCAASDQCHAAGTCNSGTGQCSNPAKPNGSGCNDANLCTQTDTCQGGVCTGSNPVVCTVSDQCHVAGTCNSGTGQCSNPAKPDGSACDDGNPCTTSDTCSGGACAGTGGDCVLSIAPVDNATRVGVSTNIILTYRDPVDPATVTPDTFRLVGPGEVVVPATVSISSSGRRPALDPNLSLASDTTYRIETTAGLLGPGSAPTQPIRSYFRTAPSSVDSRPITSASERTSPLPALSMGGSGVARAGDLDGDGIRDFISGAPGYPTEALAAQVEAGAVPIYFGSSLPGERPSPDIIFTGESAHDRAGATVAGNFDFNGDGKPDILIGAEQVNRTPNDDPQAGCNAGAPCGAGKVYLIYFDPTDTVHYPHINDPSVPDIVSLSLVGQPGGIPGVVFTGEALGDQVGFAVAGGGRVNAGTGQDILIGAPGSDPSGRTNAGRAYVIFDQALSGTVSLSRVANGAGNEVNGTVFVGEAAGDALGYSVSFPGDVMGSVGDDIAMGAPLADPTSVRTGTPQVDAGNVYVVRGGALTKGIIEVCAIGGVVDGARIQGDQAGMQLGSSVAGGGDNNANGDGDLLMGSPSYTAGTRTSAGLVAQTYTKLGRGVIDVGFVGDPSPGNPDAVDGVIWTGAKTGDRLGAAVAGVSDVTGDGFEDVAFGAPFADPVPPGGGGPIVDAGTVYVVAGAPGALRKGIIEVCDVGVTYAGEQLLGTDSGEHAGSSLAGVGDLNGDGNNDFVTGAPNSNLGGNPDSGTTYMVLDTEAQAVTGCGASGCEVADLSNGAEIDVAPGTLSSNANLAVTGILSPSALPAAVPSGKLFLGATQLGPEGQAIPSPGATIHVPAVRGLESQVSVGESLRLYYYSPTTGWRPASPEAAGWVDSTLNGTVEANPSYPDRRAVMGVVSVLHTYAVFLNDTDGDGIRDERDCAPMDAGAFAVPQEVTGLLLGPAKTALTWNSAAPAAGSATVHDLLRGAVPELPVGNKPSETCVAPGVSGTIATDSTPPQAGHGLWYLVRGRNVCGAGTYGTASNGTPRTSTACP